MTGSLTQTSYLSPDDQIDPQEMFPWPTGRRPLSPLIPPARMSPGSASAGQGFSPDADNSWASDRWWGDAPNPAGFNVSSSGPEGMGASGQPQAKQRPGEPTAGAGKVLNGRMPPPGSDTGSDATGQYRSAAQPPAALPVAPPTAAAPVARPAATLPAAAAQTQQQISDVTKRMADRQASAPQLKSNWAQRLGMAVLASTKLAPYAQQIVHPKYSEQMGEFKAGMTADEAQLRGLSSAENAASWAEQREASAEQRRAQAANYADENQRKSDADAAREQLKSDTAFTNSLGKDDVITGLDATDPNIAQLQAQGWHVIDDARDHREGVPKMKVAIPPRFVTVTDENAPILPGRTKGALVPWSEYKSSLAEYEKAQRDRINHPPPHEPVNPTHLTMRAQGVTTGNPTIDAMSPEQAKKALELGKERGPVTNIYAGQAQQDNEANANMIADYQQAPLSGTAMRSPEGRAIMARVKELNHDYHAEYYNNFNKTESDASTGKIGTSANALNAMMGHLDVLNQAADALKNNNVQLLNRLGNFVGAQTGNSAVTTYQAIVHRLGPEIAKAYVGAGSTGTERGTNEEDFDPKMSPEQLQQNVAISARLADSKIKALQDQYLRGTYGRGKQKLISDEAEAVRQRLSGAGGSVTVKDPRGVVHTFPSQQAADQFKKSAGIK